MKRAALAIVGAVLALGLVIHVPPVRGWLAAHGHHGGGTCPFGYGTTVQRKGDPTAPRAHARPALGFALGMTTRADIERWASEQGVACHAKRGGTFLACDGTTAMWFQLDDHGVLASVQATHRDPTAAAISEAFARVQGELTAEAGAPAKRDGAATPAVLASAPLRQAMVEYRFSDYHALVRATNMGDGFVLTEEFTRLD